MTTIIETSNIKTNMLLNIGPLIEGTIIKRPSKHIKSPYVADVLIYDNEVQKEIIAHSASLGCGGLAEETANVLLSILPTKGGDDNKKCTHRICLSIVSDSEHPGCEAVVGIYPKLAEQLAENALKNGNLSWLQSHDFKRETVIKIKDKVDSRFDFTGIDENGIPFIMEIKNVPIANYEETPFMKKPKNSKKASFTPDYSNYSFTSKVAYFPEGYRKKITDTVSPRALKHVKELTIIKNESNPEKPMRCILCFVIQRNDVDRFQTCSYDPEYKEAVKVAHNSGVEIMAISVKWDKNGVATLMQDNLPICF